MKVTTETDRHNIATQLSILTFNATKLSSHDIHQTSTVLQTVTSTDTISQSVRNKLITPQKIVNYFVFKMEKVKISEMLHKKLCVVVFN